MSGQKSKTPLPLITAARVHIWINTETMRPKFGVQVRAGKKWHHLAINHEAALFETPEAAQAQADEIMRQVREQER